MKLWLSQRRDGRYLLTMFRPTTNPVRGLNVYDLFVVPGDPVCVDSLCREGLATLFGEATVNSIEPLGSIRVQIEGQRIGPNE